MANTFYKRVVQEGYRNAVVQLSANLDTAVAAPTQVQQILRSDFSSNDPGFGTLTGFRFDRVQYSTSEGVFVELLWDATTDRSIVRFSGSHEEAASIYGGIRPVEADAGYTGDINVFVNAPGAAAGTQLMYFALVHLTKIY
jgi:hypothetical protein